VAVMTGAATPATCTAPADLHGAGAQPAASASSSRSATWPGSSRYGWWAIAGSSRERPRGSRPARSRPREGRDGTSNPPPAAGTRHRHLALGQVVPGVRVAVALVLPALATQDDRVHIQGQRPGLATDPSLGLGRPVQP